MEETQVWSLVWEDPTFYGATKPSCHNGACDLEFGSRNYGTHALQLLKAMRPGACVSQQEEPLQWEATAVRSRRTAN